MHPIAPAQAPPRSAEDLSSLLHRIYQAATRPQDWNDVVAALGASMGASKGLLFTPFIGPQDGGLLFPWRISEQELQLWATRYIEHDIWSLRARERGLWQEGCTYVSEDMVSPQELRASVFYKEFLSQHGIESICAGIVFEGAPGLPHTSVSFFRDRDAPAFDEADKAWLRLLLTHLSRALGLMHRLQALDLRATSLRAALDRLAFGVLLLNAQRQVVHANAVAHKVLARDDGLRLDADGRLQPPSGDDGARLPRGPAGAIALEPAAHFSDGLLVPRTQAGQAYFVQHAVVPASDEWALDGDTVHHLVFVTDPAATQLPSAQRLCALYGLTRAEARISLELALGKSQKEVAQGLGISLSTARTHTQSVFAKTRTRRHAELVRTVLWLGQVAA